MVGEFFHYWFPDGIGGVEIQPGCYALVGSAAMSGAVTRTISTSVIVFELTGQIAHSLPVLIAVILANMVAQCLQPSMYDSIIQMKQLPFLPDIVSASRDFYDITAEHIMQTKLSYICWRQPYKEVYSIIRSLSKNEVVPLVESHESMVLLGTVRVGILQAKIQQHISRAALLKFIRNGSDFNALNLRTQPKFRRNPNAGSNDNENRRYKSERNAGKAPGNVSISNTINDASAPDSQYLSERRQSKAVFNTDFQSFLTTNPAAMKKTKVKPLGNLFSGSIADVSTASSLVQDHAALAAAYQHSKRTSITGKY